MAAASLGKPAIVRAADGEPVLLGQSNTAEHGTMITRSPGLDDTVAIAGVNAAGVGVRGESTSGEGVIGISQSGGGVQGYSQAVAGVNGFGPIGVYGGGGDHGVAGNSPNLGTLGRSLNHNTGVFGYSGGEAEALPAFQPKTGVLGFAAQDASSRGVWGRSTAGQGVRGEATTGTGGAFASTTGYALSTSGRVRLTKVSGVAAIAAGTAAKTINPGVDLTAASFVLLTPRGNLGGRDLWYTVDTAANTFTIRVSSAVPGAMGVGWLLLS